MFASLLLAAFPFLLAVSVLGGLLLLAMGGARNRYASGTEAADGARSIALFANVWSVAMGIFLYVSTEVMAYGAGWSLLVPIVICVVPLTSDETRRFVLLCAAGGIVLGICSFIAGFSIGPAYTPSAALLSAAGWVAFLGRKRAHG